MGSIRIPRKVILEHVLKGAGCSVAEYKNWAISTVKFVAIVRFKSDASRKSEDSGFTVHTGGPCRTIELAEEQAAEEAIRYIQRAHHLDVDDINYRDRLISGYENHSYASEMRACDQKFMALENGVADLKDGWEYTINQIQQLEGYTTGLLQAGKETQMSMDVEVGENEETGFNIADVTAKLASLGTDASEALKRSTEELE